MTIIKTFGLKMEIAMILKDFVILIFIMNLCGCLFTASSNFDFITVNGWIYKFFYEDDSNLEIYVTAVYWSVTTCATVGYGDILPVNEFEKMLTVFVLILGVSTFSYCLSDLSTQFSELQKDSKVKEDRQRTLEELETKFKVDPKVL